MGSQHVVLRPEIGRSALNASQLSSQINDGATMNGFYFDSVNIATDNKDKEQDRLLAAESDEEESPLNENSIDTTPKNQEAGAIIQDREDDQITKNADEWNFADI